MGIFGMHECNAQRAPRPAPTDDHLPGARTSFSAIGHPWIASTTLPTAVRDAVMRRVAPSPRARSIGYRTRHSEADASG